MSLIEYLKIDTTTLPGNDNRLFIIPKDDINNVVISGNTLMEINLESDKSWTKIEADFNSILYDSKGSNDVTYFSKQTLSCNLSQKNDGLIFTLDSLKKEINREFVILRLDTNGRGWISGVCKEEDEHINIGWNELKIDFSSGTDLEESEDGNMINLEFNRTAAPEEYMLHSDLVDEFWDWPISFHINLIIKVYDDSMDSWLEGATVTFRTNEKTTDEEGITLFENENEGVGNYNVSKEYYNPKSGSVTLDKDEPEKEITVNLEDTWEDYNSYHYNWWALDGLANTDVADWRVPTDEDLKKLEAAADSTYDENWSGWDEEGWRLDSDAGHRLKSSFAWYNNKSGVNSLNLNITPSGARNSYNGWPNNSRSHYFIWSTTEAPGTPGESRAWYRRIYWNVIHTFRSYSQFGTTDTTEITKTAGMNVRLVRDATINEQDSEHTDFLEELEIQTDFYEGHNNVLYDAVRIGEYIWLRDNLKETQRKVGETLVTIQDLSGWDNNATWIALDDEAALTKYEE